MPRRHLSWCWFNTLLLLLAGCAPGTASRTEIEINRPGEGRPPGSYSPTASPALSKTREPLRPELPVPIETATIPTATVTPLQRVVPTVVAKYRHDSAAFTQGLVWNEGRLFESTGIGSISGSSVREVDLESGRVSRLFMLDREYFGEGLALVDDRLIQLTWKRGVAFVYNAGSLEKVGEFSYEGEGWGLCYDGSRLWMSDGSSRLQIRNPVTFELLAMVEVTREGEPVSLLNELECVGPYIYANVWKTDQILRIEKETGWVSAVIDAGTLLSESERAELNANQVLNGIAYDPTTNLFFLTGKEWPWLFAVRFDPSP